MLGDDKPKNLCTVNELLSHFHENLHYCQLKMEASVKNLLLSIIVDSSSQSSDELEDLETIERLLKNRRAKQASELSRRRRHVMKNENYYETVKLYELDTFKSHFRITREAVAKLAGDLTPAYQNLRKNEFGGRNDISLEKRILLTLWTLANIESFRSISDRFGVAKESAYGIFVSTCEMVSSLQNNIIKWPTNYEEAVAEFNSLRATPFPGIIGVVDGVDIPTVAPHYDKGSYYNRKGGFSVKMQGICDSKLRFIDVYIGYPGACHDASMWTSSPIYNKLQAEDLKECHLLGDSAYPLDMFLMKPFRDNGNLTNEEKTFNRILSSHRMLIENAFGLLKGKFRRLKYLHMFIMEKIPTIVMACCVLHNIALGDDHHISEVTSDNNQEISSTSGGNYADEDLTNNAAQIKGQHLCNLLNN